MNEMDERALAAFEATGPEGPVVMLNLLRFRPDGGRESYRRYIEQLGQGIRQRYGLEIVYLGEGGPALVAEEGQAWDSVVLVRYPDRRAFLAMVRDPEYRAAAHLRSEALLEAVLQPTTPSAA